MFRRFVSALLALTLLGSPLAAQQVGGPQLVASNPTTPVFLPEPRPRALTAGQYYSFMPLRQGGAGTPTWSVSGCTLPSGLTASTTTGEISGTPAVDATVGPCTMTVTDSTGSFTRGFYLGAAPVQTALTLNPPLRLPKLAAAIQLLKAGIADVTIQTWGDSTTAGFGAKGGYLGSSTYGSARDQSGPSVLLSRLGQSLAVPVQRYSVMGAGPGDVDAQIILSEPRVQVSGGYTFGLGRTFGGPFLGLTSPGTIGITIEKGADQATLRWLTAGSAGVFTYSLDGGTPVQVNQAGGNGLATQAFTGLDRSVPHALTISWVSGTVFIQGITAFDTTTRSIRLLNGGVSGSSTGDWTSSFPWTPGNAATALGSASLVIVNLGINDYNQSVPTATYSSQLSAILVRAKALGGDVLCVVPHPTGGTVARSVQVTYRAAEVSTCAANGIQVLDLEAPFGQYADALATGKMSDLLHPSNLGYRGGWTWLADRILSAVSGAVPQ